MDTENMNADFSEQMPDAQPLTQSEPGSVTAPAKAPVPPAADEPDESDTQPVTQARTETVIPPVVTPAPQVYYIPDDTKMRKAEYVKERYKLARSAYNRTGLSVLVLYFAMSVISSVIVALGAIPAIINLFLTVDYREIANFFDFDSFSEYYRYLYGMIQTESLITWIVIATVIGTGVGLGLGILFQRLVIKSLPARPIDKRVLTCGEFGIYLISTLGLWSVGVFIGNLPSFFGVGSFMDDYMEMFTGPGAILLTLYAVFGAPVLEELAFRKCLLDKIYNYGQVPAAIISAFMFGLFHGNSGQFFLAFNVGLLFAVIYMKTGKVIYTMLLHFLVNLTASLPDFLSWFGVNSFGPVSTDTVLYILLGVFAVVGSLVIVCNRKSELFAISRPDYPGARRALLRNPGMWIFPILTADTIVGLDLYSLIFGLIIYRTGLVSLLVLVPASLFVASVIVFYCFIGKRTDEPRLGPVEVSPDADAPVTDAETAAV